MKLDTDANMQRRLSTNVTLVVLLLPPPPKGARSAFCICMISFSISKHRPVKVDNEIVYRSAGARRIQSKCGVSRSERFKQVSEGWEGKGECGVKGGHRSNVAL